MLSRGVGKLGLLVILAILVLVGWLAWRFLPLVGVTSTRDVQAACAEKAMEVTLRGRVETSVDLPLSDFFLFKVADDSGSMWVFAEREPPSKGEIARISGRTFSAANIGESCVTSGLGEGFCGALAGAARFISAESCILVETTSTK